MKHILDITKARIVCIIIIIIIVIIVVVVLVLVVLVYVVIIKHRCGCGPLEVSDQNSPPQHYLLSMS